MFTRSETLRKMFASSLYFIQGKFRWPLRKINISNRHISNRHCFAYKHFTLSEKSYSFPKFCKNAELFLSSNSRYYAKSRDIKKDKKKQIKIDETELQEYFDLEALFTDLKKPVEHFKEELVKHATLRTSPNAIESVKISFEGDNYTIRDLAEVGKKNPKLYVLDFSSLPAVIPTVLTTLQKLELNLNAQQDGTKVFVPIPKVTREYREILAKKSKLYFHKCKESIRNVQMAYIKRLDKIENVPAEEKFQIRNQLTALGDKQILVAEGILKAKQEELLKDNAV